MKLNWKCSNVETMFKKMMADGQLIGCMSVSVFCGVGRGRRGWGSFLFSLSKAWALLLCSGPLYAQYRCWSLGVVVPVSHFKDPGLVQPHTVLATAHWNCSSSLVLLAPALSPVITNIWPRWEIQAMRVLQITHRARRRKRGGKSGEGRRCLFSWF